MIVHRPFPIFTSQVPLLSSFLVLLLVLLISEYPQIGVWEESKVSVNKWLIKRNGRVSLNAGTGQLLLTPTSVLLLHVANTSSNLCTFCSTGPQLNTSSFKPWQTLPFLLLNSSDWWCHNICWRHLLILLGSLLEVGEKGKAVAVIWIHIFSNLSTFLYPAQL